MEDKLIVSGSPHVNHKDSTRSIMLDVIIAMVPALLVSIYVFGLRALSVTLVSVASCVLSEYVFRKIAKRTNTIHDLSAVVTGMILAFNLPATIPLWMVAIGGFVSIFIIKQLFGGLGQNFVNPAIGGRIVLFISFATAMTTWMVPFGYKSGLVAGATPLTALLGYRPDTIITGATPLGLVAMEAAELPTYAQLFFGNIGGSIGEISSFALLIGGVYLVIKKVISPIIPVTFVATVFVFVSLLGHDGLYHILSGGLMFGAIFMATDYATSPLTNKGKIIFAVGCGVVTTIIRIFGSYPEGVSFAIILMNILTPLIERVSLISPLGGVK